MILWHFLIPLLTAHAERADWALGRMSLCVNVCVSVEFCLLYMYIYDVYLFIIIKIIRTLKNISVSLRGENKIFSMSYHQI